MSDDITAQHTVSPLTTLFNAANQAVTPDKADAAMENAMELLCKLGVDVDSPDIFGRPVMEDVVTHLTTAFVLMGSDRIKFND